MNNKKCSLHLRDWLTALMLFAATSIVSAADAVIADGVLPSDTGGSDRAESRWQQRFISEFSEFAGSAENAQSLYSGLRKGSRITLTTPTLNSSGGTGTSVLQFNPAGRPAGIGSAFISMALAKQQLAGHGITRPAPAQIRAALNGGAISPGNVRSEPVALKGVLAQREQGLGWQVIAKASGISPGRILDGLRHPATDPVAGGAADAYARAGTRGSRLAAASGVAGPLRTSAGMAAQEHGLIAQ